jgi:hypothetical protein
MFGTMTVPFKFNGFVKCPISAFRFILRHSGEGRKPVIAIRYGCRIKFGVTAQPLFTSSSTFNDPSTWRGNKLISRIMIIRHFWRGCRIHGNLTRSPAWPEGTCGNLQDRCVISADKACFPQVPAQVADLRRENLEYARASRITFRRTRHPRRRPGHESKSGAYTPRACCPAHWRRPA